jgi:hypothetical protein
MAKRIDYGRPRTALLGQLDSKLRDEEIRVSPRQQEYFSIAELAERWRVSRSAVYGYLRGYAVVDFAPSPGRKGHKLVSVETVFQIERERLRVMR